MSDSLPDFLTQWKNESEENEKAVARERLKTEVTEAICEAMSAAKIDQGELAKRLGCTQTFVPRVLEGTQDMTLNVLADIFFVLKKTPGIMLVDE